jgi:hypothetical protein
MDCASAAGLGKFVAAMAVVSDTLLKTPARKLENRQARF